SLTQIMPTKCLFWTYEWNMVRFSNFSSPEYIIELRKTQTLRSHRLLTGGQRDSLPQCLGSHVGYLLSGTVQTCGWSLSAHRLRRSTLQEPQWLLLATSPS
uniref:Uncharacterized protein n=1 Tax=Amphiprion ocellaris TaxID=80972 RepID=A0A3Q1AW68_AMPOC